MKEDHDDFAFEPSPGLPDRLPQGEALLWQGSPDWRALARSAFHVRKVAAYFAILLAWQWASAEAGASAADLAGSFLRLAAVGAAAIGILCLLAFLYARGTIYTLTQRRIVIRSGLALPITLNLPLALIETASLGKLSDGTASIALTVTPPNRVAYLALWPNARPWRLSNPQPMLRCIKDAKAVVPLLARALEAQGPKAAERPPVRAVAPQTGERGVMPDGRSVAA